VARLAKVVTTDPRSVPRNLPFRYEVRVAESGKWDDDDPPDETVLHFSSKLAREVLQLKGGRSVQIRLAHTSQLEDTELARAVEAAHAHGREVRIRLPS
jgi:hypothetical protein